MCRSQMAAFSVSRSRGRTGSFNDCRRVLRVTFWAPPNKALQQTAAAILVPLEIKALGAAATAERCR